MLSTARLPGEVPFWESDYAILEELDGHPQIRAVHASWVAAMGGGESAGRRRGSLRSRREGPAESAQVVWKLF